MKNTVMYCKNQGSEDEKSIENDAKISLESVLGPKLMLSWLKLAARYPKLAPRYAKFASRWLKMAQDSFLGGSKGA